jgi:hypothetical protein
MLVRAPFDLEFSLKSYGQQDRSKRNGAESQNRTDDTAIFSRVLYQLSYLGPAAGPV